jgi:WD40 repeat protein
MPVINSFSAVFAVVISAVLAGCAGMEMPSDGKASASVDVTSYAEVRSWPMEDAVMSASGLSADGGIALVTYKDPENGSKLHRFNLETGSQDTFDRGATPDGMSIRPSGYVNALAFANSGHELLVNWPQYLVRMDAASGQTLAVTGIPDAPSAGHTMFNTLKYAASGNVAYGLGSTLVRFDLSEGAMKPMRDTPAVGGRALAVLADNRAATGSSQELVIGTAGKEAPDCSVEGVFNDLEVSPDGSRFTGSIYDRESKSVTMYVWSAADCTELLSWPAGAGFVPDVAWLPDGNTIAAAGGDGLLRFWDAGSGTLIHTLTVENEAGFRMHFSGNGMRLATVSLWGDDKSVRVFEAQ